MFNVRECKALYSAALNAALMKFAIKSELSIHVTAPELGTVIQRHFYELYVHYIWQR